MNEIRPPDWDAATYDRISDMQYEWGRSFLERLDLRGDEVALDAGCGTGRITRLLAERLPRGRVIAADASPSMIERARENLGPNVTFVVSDLLELDLAEEVDLVFSTATFHWILDQDGLYRVLHRALLPGGRLEAQCGGSGNVEDLRRAVELASREEPFARHLSGIEHPWVFPSPDEATGRLERAGFVDVHCSLEEKLVGFDNPREWSRTVGLPVHLSRLPAELHEAFIDATLDRVGDLENLRFVRLNISAARPG